MSYHEIEVTQRWVVGCIDCGFQARVKTAGQAEEAARAHIDLETREEAMPNYYHLVSISSVNVVGRQQ